MLKHKKNQLPQTQKSLTKYLSNTHLIILRNNLHPYQIPHFPILNTHLTSFLSLINKLIIIIQRIIQK